MAMLVFFHAVDPSENMSYITCFLVRMATILLGANRMLSEPAVALGRYVNLSQCNSIRKVCKIFYLFRLFYLCKERIGDIAQEPYDGTDEQPLPDDDPEADREAGLGTEGSPAAATTRSLGSLQPPQVAGQNEVSASDVAPPSKPEHEEANEGISGASHEWRIIQVPPAQPQHEDGNHHEDQRSQGCPDKVDPAPASDVYSAKTAGEAGPIPKPLGEHSLHEDTWFKNINEVKLFSRILWLYPTIVGLIVAVLLGENFLDSHRVSEFLSSELYTWHRIKRLYFVKVLAMLQGLSFIITIAIHILLFYRLRELETKRAEGIMLVNYQRDGIKISKRSPDLQTSKKLWMYNRTVVSPKASLISFIYNILFKIMIISLLFVYGMRIQTMQIIVLCHLFCFCNLVEAIFSPSLRENLPRCQNRFHVVMV